jgi:hypothetical protein
MGLTQSFSQKRKINGCVGFSAKSNQHNRKVVKIKKDKISCNQCDLKYKADLLQSETVNPLQSETVNPLQSETVNPLHDEIIDPLHDETVNPLQSETVNPLQSETVNHLQSERNNLTDTIKI